MGVDVVGAVDLVVDGAVDMSATIVVDLVGGDERGIELLEAVVAMLTKMITVESST